MMRHRFIERISRAHFAQASGTVLRANLEHLDASGPTTQIGDYCEIAMVGGGAAPFLAEVVSVQPDFIRLVPLEASARVAIGAQVTLAENLHRIPVGEPYAGRAIDALARPLDGDGPVWPGEYLSRSGNLLPVFQRTAPRNQLATGVRAIDSVLPLGKGQRTGIFAASGVGKTSLIEQLARQADCDRIVMCLVGERGREVEKIWTMLQTSANRARGSLVATTADESASLRLRALEQAIGLAEHWREKGEHVLLVVDSITRVAMALREIGLASGLPPSVRGYTPNVFSVLPRMVERCGASRAGGAITALFTVLCETDDVDDPLVELMKSLLDGHIVLSRELAEKRHFPPIDVTRSVSRLADELLETQWLELLRAAHASLATHEQARPMIESGLYREGADSTIDKAIARQDGLIEFLVQSRTENTPLEETREKLATVMRGAPHGE